MSRCPLRVPVAFVALLGLVLAAACTSKTSGGVTPCPTCEAATVCTVRCTDAGQPGEPACLNQDDAGVFREADGAAVPICAGF